MTKDDLTALINQHVAASDQQMSMIVGYFLIWYAQIDLGITNILIALARSKDLARFAVLTRGMDAKVKIDRIKELAKLDDGLGPNLEARLDYFYRRIAGLRNRLAHSTVRQKEHEIGNYQIVSFASWATVNADYDRLNELGTHVTAKELLELGTWMRKFVPDIGQAMSAATRGRIPEIDNPLTVLPTDALPNHPQPKKPAKKRKPSGKAP